MPIGASEPTYLPLEEGKRVGGEILHFRVQQRNDYEAPRPLYMGRKDGGERFKTFDPYAEDGTPNEPICDWIFTVDIGIPDDAGDTERRIFLDPRKGARGTAVEGLRGKDAIEKAVRAAGAHRIGLEIGGQIFITRGPKVQPRRGEAACITYTAEYVPPPGGPGTGKPVDETMWLVGGARFDPTAKAAPAQPAAAPVDGPVDQGLRERTQQITDQLARAHASSPVLNKPTGQPSTFDDEPPF